MAVGIIGVGDGFPNEIGADLRIGEPSPVVEKIPDDNAGVGLPRDYSLPSLGDGFGAIGGH